MPRVSKQHEETESRSSDFGNRPSLVRQLHLFHGDRRLQRL